MISVYLLLDSGYNGVSFAVGRFGETHLASGEREVERENRHILYCGMDVGSERLLLGVVPEKCVIVDESGGGERAFEHTRAPKMLIALRPRHVDAVVSGGLFFFFDATATTETQLRLIE